MTQDPARSVTNLAAAQAALDRIEVLETFGRVVAIRGLLVEVAGPVAAMRLGGRIDVEGANGLGLVPCEIIGFQGDRALAMPFGSLEGVRRGCPAYVRDESAGAIRPSSAWLGRVVDALGRPVDGLGPLPQGPDVYALRADPPPAHARTRVGGPLDLGVRCINTFLTMCAGQRMGIFAGSGVGKSVLLSMLARYTAADVAVIGLVGERGREVQEFLQDDLGAAGLARSVVVVATSDEPALMRRNAAYVTLSVAEHFRDQGAKVLCMIDSITRFAMAQRDIGLAAGEPPTAKGYTPTVFSELPRLLERAGPGVGLGTISACSPCWSRATTTTSRWPTRSAASSTGTSSWSGPSPSAGAIRRSTCCARSPGPCRAPAIRPICRWSAGPAGCSRPTPTWRS